MHDAELGRGGAGRRSVALHPRDGAWRIPWEKDNLSVHYVTALLMQ